MIREPHHREDVKSYLIEGSRDVAVLDTGTGAGDFAGLVASLSSRRPRVLQTHADWDHIGASFRFDEVLVHPIGGRDASRRVSGRSLRRRNSRPNRSIAAGFRANSIPAPGFPVALRPAGLSMATVSISASACWSSFIPRVTRRAASPFSTGRRERSSSAIFSIWDRCSCSFQEATRLLSASHCV